MIRQFIIYYEVTLADGSKVKDHYVTFQSRVEVAYDVVREAMRVKYGNVKDYWIFKTIDTSTNKDNK